MKTLTEAQAWTRIARDIEKGTWARRGLCFEAYGLYSSGRISFPTQMAMNARVQDHIAGDYFDSLYAWPAGEAEPRILAASFLALEAADEARAAR